MRLQDSLTLHGPSSFPVYLHLLGHTLHPHFAFELLGYLVGLLAFLILRALHGDSVLAPVRLSVIAAAFAGGAAGSRVLYLVEDPSMLLARWRDPHVLLGGKTILGGLLGGWAAVEWMKSFVGEHAPTGDLLAAPLCLGIAVGRIGCFLTGLGDRTYGSPTLLPVGVDFGDGVLRHPTQLYESFFLLALVPVLLWLMAPRGGPRAFVRRGDVFKAFMAAYCTFRLFVDFLKPSDPVVLLGLKSLQWAALAGVLAVLWARWSPRGVKAGGVGDE